MDQKSWSAVDAFIVERLIRPEAALDDALAANAAAGLPAHDVSPAQGKFLHLLARIIGARHIREIDTLGGFPPSGLPARCPRTAGSSHSRPIRAMPRGFLRGHARAGIFLPEFETFCSRRN
jgi:hypothetical protein